MLNITRELARELEETKADVAARVKQQVELQRAQFTVEIERAHAQTQQLASVVESYERMMAEGKRKDIASPDQAAAARNARWAAAQRLPCHASNISAPAML